MKFIAGIVATVMLCSPLLVLAQTTGSTGTSGTGSTVSASDSSGSNTSGTNCRFLGGYVNPLCWLESAATWIAAILISIAITVMTWVGWLFNIVISQTVLGFDQWIKGSVLTAISTGWTFFRDVANIVIIGLFVFIAICLILGIKSYGQRSFIARVLVVAVLINFSFLFTRIVISFSNNLAIQFAKIQPLDAQSSQAGTTPPDIAGKFTDLMGVKSLSNTKDTLQKMTVNSNSIWLTLLHALMVVIVALGVAVVLMYGAFLLIARALIFIFLLVTSSLAFATYLLPNFASSDFGWKAWWTALLRNAMLAPIMMLFLAVTLQISKGLVAAINGTSGNVGVLGALAAQPDNSKNISSLLIYILVLGLLYGAIRISNKFSGAAGQLSWSLTQPFANATVAWPSRSLGLLGRTFIGRPAYSLSENLKEKSQDTSRSMFYRKSMDSLSQLAKRPAKADFNPGNLTNIKSAQTKIGGEEGRRNRIDHNAMEVAKRITPNQEAMKALLKKNREKAATEFAPVKAEAEKKLKEATEIKTQKEQVIKREEAKQADIGKEITSLSNRIKEINDKKDAASAAELKDLTDKEAQLGKKRIESDAQSRVIEAAKQEAEARVQASKEADAAVKEIEKRISQRALELMPTGTVDNKGNLVSQKKRTVETAAEAGFERASNFIPRMAGTNTLQNDSIANQIRHHGEKHLDEEDTAKAIKKALGGEFNKVVNAIESGNAQAEHAGHVANDNIKEIKKNTANGHGH